MKKYGPRVRRDMAKILSIVLVLLLITTLHFTVNVQRAKLGGTIRGDIDGNGRVDIFDTMLLASSFTATPDAPNWNPNADLNGDNIIDIFDALILSTAFGAHAIEGTPTIEKAASVYGSWWTDADTSFVADHFTLLDADFDGCRTDFYIPYLQAMQSIKAKNPNVKIIGYKNLIGMYTYLDDWAEANSHEDWFVHDASGNRILNVDWGWYLMDVGVQGWRQHWVSYVNGKMNNTAYDGVFADDVWNAIADWSLSAFDKVIPASVISRWHNDTIGMLQHVKDNLLPSKILINNSDEWSTNDYISITDGELIEGYAHAPWNALADFERPSIDVLARKCATGKIVWASSGIDTSTATRPQIDAMLKYCYASFLIGMSGSKAYWSWNTYGTIYSDLSSRYQPIMDTEIGQPIGSNYTSQNVVIRNFAGGKVLLNPSASSYNVSLEKPYITLDGQTVTSATLGPHTGEVLFATST
jgi:hypothetical protein